VSAPARRPRVARVSPLASLASLARLARLAPASLLAACLPVAQGVEGRVVDHATGRPVAGAAVTLTGRGWGLSDGELVWDKDYAARTHADAAGRFRARVRGGSVRIAVDADGYLRYGGFLDGRSAELRLQPLRATNPALRRGLLDVGQRDGVPYGWVLAEARTTTVRDSADIFARVVPGAGGQTEVVLQAPEGIRFLPATEFGPVDDPLVYVNEAPLTGYAASLRVRPGGSGVLVVRARDGRFAKLHANPSMLGSAREAAAGTRGFRFQYVYNPEPGRDLTWQPPALR
jgi:hypothetical protein